MSGPVETSRPLLLFRFGGSTRAVEAAAVREVVRAVALEPLPGAPDHVQGVMNLRGEVVPVLDLRARVGVEMPASHADHLLVLDTGKRLVALRCDEALDLVDFDGADRQEAEGLSANDEVAACVATPEGVLVVHDVEALLAGKPGEQLDEALSRLAGAEP